MTQLHHIGIDGRNVAYEKSGNGPHPVIFVHGGFGSSSVLWRETMARLPAEQTGYAINNFVWSAAPPDGYSVHAFARRVVNFAKALGLKRPVLVGHSMGGVVCQLAALAAPELIGGLVLIGTGASVRNHGLAHELLAEMERDGVDGDQIRANSALWFATAPKEFFERYVEAAIQAPGKAIVDVQRTLVETDIEDRLGAIACPALVVHGRLDTGRRIEHAETLYRGIAGSELLVIDESGHSPMVETPAAFDERFHAFLARIADPATAS